MYSWHHQTHFSTHRKILRSHLGALVRPRLKQSSRCLIWHLHSWQVLPPELRVCEEKTLAVVTVKLSDFHVDAFGVYYLHLSLFIKCFWSLFGSSPSLLWNRHPNFCISVVWQPVSSRPTKNKKNFVAKYWRSPSSKCIVTFCHWMPTWIVSGDFGLII